jgi:hypothetical protein
MKDEIKTELKDRLTSGSSMAGYALIVQSIAMLVASHGADITAWGSLLAGIGAVLRK